MSRFLIVSHVIHKEVNGRIGAYGPYVKEMNIWFKHVQKVIVVAPIKKSDLLPIDLLYEHSNIQFIVVPDINLNSGLGLIKTFLFLPYIILAVAYGMLKSDHIHLRCPGNMGLIGALVQCLFPMKKKTAKYAGNWDWDSKQPWSYRLQQKILRNTRITKNMQVLVYGDWPDKTKNIKSFFTASYSEKDKLHVSPDEKLKSLKEKVNLVFIGTLSTNKRPDICLKVLNLLIEHGINAAAHFLGEGPLRSELELNAKEQKLQNEVIFYGNVTADKVKLILQEAHFLVFASRSEGWPKVVAEAMWWGCLPITTAVSCVPQMIGNNSRGQIINEDAREGFEKIIQYCKNPSIYKRHIINAVNWSRNYSLEYFENQIFKLI